MGGVSLGRRLRAAAHVMLRGWEIWDEKDWYQYSQGNPTKAGTRINETSSLKLSAVFAAVNFIASAIATLPKSIYRRLPDGRRIAATDHPLYDRIHNAPNESGLTSWQWIYTSLFHKYLWGNWYTWIDRKAFRNQELVPLLPDRTYRDPDDPETYITYDKKATPPLLRLPRSQVLHIPHISLDGVTGKGIVHYARESLGIAKALDEMAAKFFKNGLHMGGFVEIQGAMDPDRKRDLQEDFNKKYSGLGEAYKVIFMSGGAKYVPEEIDAQKAQALESRQFSVLEVSRWMNLPPHILRELTRATFSNIEHQGLELVVYTLLPLTTQIEQAMNIALLDREERRDVYVKFELKGLLRGDLTARQAFYQAMLDRGVFNADNVLELEDMDPQPSGLGQVYLVPLNMVNKEYAIGEPDLNVGGPGNDDSGNGGTDAAAPVVSALRKTVDSTLPNPARVLRNGKATMALRRKVTIVYIKQFKNCGGSVVGEETKAIREAVSTTLRARGAAEFETWLDEFYRGFSKRIKQLSAPLISSYAAAMQPIVQEELGSDVDVSSQYAEFERGYQTSFVTRHVKSSKGQLKSVVRNAVDTGEDPAAAVEQRIEEWEQTRPEKIANRESIRAEGAFARAIFTACGVVKIMSVAFGDNCPYCGPLDGRVIGIDQNFLTPGDFQPDGADKPLTITSNRGHPPYHDGCDCGIVAAVG